ncbi:MAG: Tfp pilus assembly protein FimT/FimU, partial [Candidatus Methylacidiphilales bacterium]
KGFTLIELIAVISIVSVLAVATVQSIGPMRGNELSAASRVVSSLMAVARSEAISRNTLTRFMVISEWPGKENRNYRLVSVWAYDNVEAVWKQSTKWEELPTSVTVDPLPAANYSVDNSPQDYFTKSDDNIFSTEINGATVQARFIEYLPTGASRAAKDVAAETWLALVSASGVVKGPDGVSHSNWSKISSNSLTGRIKVTWP